MAYPGYLLMDIIGVPASAGSGFPGSMLLPRKASNRLKPGLQDGIFRLFAQRA